MKNILVLSALLALVAAACGGEEPAGSSGKSGNNSNPSGSSSGTNSTDRTDSSDTSDPEDTTDPGETGEGTDPEVNPATTLQLTTFVDIENYHVTILDKQDDDRVYLDKDCNASTCTFDIATPETQYHHEEFDGFWADFGFYRIAIEKDDYLFALRYFVVLDGKIVPFDITVENGDEALGDPSDTFSWNEPGDFGVVVNGTYANDVEEDFFDVTTEITENKVVMVGLPGSQIFKMQNFLIQDVQDVYISEGNVSQDKHIIDYKAWEKDDPSQTPSLERTLHLVE